MVSTQRRQLQRHPCSFVSNILPFHLFFNFKLNDVLRAVNTSFMRTIDQLKFRANHFPWFVRERERTVLLGVSSSQTLWATAHLVFFLTNLAGGLPGALEL